MLTLIFGILLGDHLLLHSRNSCALKEIFEAFKTFIFFGILISEYLMAVCGSGNAAWRHTQTMHDVTLTQRTVRMRSRDYHPGPEVEQRLPARPPRPPAETNAS